jgi:phosphinothricin acetyltransferase
MQFAHRLARPDDLADIVAIYNSTISSRMVTADIEPVSVASRMPWFEQHQDGQRPLWVVEHDGRIHGWLCYSDFHPRPAYRHTAELSLYVDAAARGQGLGAYLLQQAIEHAPALAIHSLVGLIFGHNIPSLRLFERFGFARWADMPGVAELDGIERDLVIVGKRIS